MFNYKVVKVARSELSTVSLHCPLWEVPILGYIHGEEKVTIVGDFPVNKQLPDPRKEFERLTLKYRSNRETGKDQVAEVYGAGPLGVKNLGDAIRAAANEEAAAAQGDAGDLGEMFEATDDPTAGLYDDQPAFAAGARPIDA